MKPRSIVVIFFLSLLFYACASPVTYGPATGADTVGYSETAIESDRYRVTFRGGEPATAYDYALLRAAELTLAQGHDWFRVTNAFSGEEGGGRSGTGISIGGSTGSYGSGVGVGIGFPLGGTSRIAVQTFEIILGSGPKPEGADVYDAKSVSDSMKVKMAAGGA